jgi:hypothetical protein
MPAAIRQPDHLRACGLGWSSHISGMPVAWKIIAYKRPKEIGDLSTREFFLVALPESDAAVAVIRMREGYDDAELEVTGQASAESLDWLDIKPGQIFCVWALQ